jgi:hypothetical protein
LHSAFNVIASFMPTASRRSRLPAFRARHEISGLKELVETRGWLKFIILTVLVEECDLL